MRTKKSEQELIEMYKAIGVDYTKLRAYGEMNVLITTWAQDPKFLDDPEDIFKIAPVIYMPRKETSYEAEEYDLRDEDQKKEYLSVCENAIERFKIWQHLLQKHIDEIKTQGYPSTTVYYPELEEYDD